MPLRNPATGSTTINYSSCCSSAFITVSVLRPHFPWVLPSPWLNMEAKSTKASSFQQVTGLLQINLAWQTPHQPARTCWEPCYHLRLLLPYSSISLSLQILDWSEGFLHLCKLPCPQSISDTTNLIFLFSSWQTTANDSENGPRKQAVRWGFGTPSSELKGYHLEWGRLKISLAAT